jgi:hypothetical protein
MKRFSLVYLPAIAYRRAIFSAVDAVIHEILGPILAKMVLNKAGEIAG